MNSEDIKALVSEMEQKLDQGVYNTDQIINVFRSKRVTVDDLEKAGVSIDSVSYWRSRGLSLNHD